VAAPQSGDSTQKPGEAAEAVSPVPPSPLATHSPAKAALKTGTKFVKPSAPQEKEENESAFAERMAKLSGKVESRQYEEKLKRMSNKAKTGGNSRVGMPGAAGAEAGSRYADFIKSRLEDALKVTSYSTTKNPEVAVRMTITEDGKLLRMKIERSSGDAAFELAVRRAIDLASQKFTPPPGRVIFENGFIFKPKGISSSMQQ
jgi:colicin import membrane protein